MTRNRATAWTFAIASVLTPAVLAAAETDLVWHAETLAGEVISSSAANRPVNPASVVKIATSLFALEALGPDHRYETGFVLDGSFDPASGRLTGDLLVLGGHDPDFHFENAVLVARELNELGVRHVDGDLRVDRHFWIGWEQGSEGREHDPRARTRLMAERLRDTLDPARWDGGSRLGWREWGERDPERPAAPPALTVGGGIGEHRASAIEATIVHGSKPLRAILKRLLAYSNNDIERVAEPLGGAVALQAFLRELLGADAGTIELETTSGLGRNRMTARGVVALLRAFRSRLAAHELGPGDLLPMTGCDPGSLEQALPRWQDGPRRGAMAAKTGTLIRQDGGVAALAGYLYGVDDTALFMVAAPRSGPRIAAARRDIETFASTTVNLQGGPWSRSCGAAVESSEAQAVVGRATGSTTIAAAANPPAR